MAKGQQPANTNSSKPRIRAVPNNLNATLRNFLTDMRNHILSGPKVDGTGNAPSNAAPNSSIGGGGSAAAGYVFTQLVAATTWVIHHNLNKFPSVTIIVGGKQVLADVEYTNQNEVHITFSSAQAGKATLL